VYGYVVSSIRAWHRIRRGRRTDSACLDVDFDFHDGHDDPDVARLVQQFRRFHGRDNTSPTRSAALLAGHILWHHGIEHDLTTGFPSSTGASTDIAMRLPVLDLERQLTVAIQFLNGSFTAIVEPIPPIVLTDRQINLDAELLPELTVDEVDWSTPDRPRIPWRTTRRTNIDALAITFFGNADSSYEWKLLLPMAETSTAGLSFVIPELPSAFAQARPRMELPNLLLVQVIDWEAVNNSAATKTRSRLLAGSFPTNTPPSERLRASAAIRR
jgi:hypothetical protein